MSWNISNLRSKRKSKVISFNIFQCHVLKCKSVWESLQPTENMISNESNKLIEQNIVLPLATNKSFFLHQFHYNIILNRCLFCPEWLEMSTILNTLIVRKSLRREIFTLKHLLSKNFTSFSQAEAGRIHSTQKNTHPTLSSIPPGKMWRKK